MDCLGAFTLLIGVARLSSRLKRVYHIDMFFFVVVIVDYIGHIFTRADLNLHLKRLSLKLTQGYLIDALYPDAPGKGNKMIGFGLVPFIKTHKYSKYLEKIMFTVI